MRDQTILRIVSKALIPFILLFAFYVLLHGKYSPGGGFQAGAIAAAAFMLHAFIFSARRTLRLIPAHRLLQGAALGVFLYLATGIASMVQGGSFLAYASLAADKHRGEFLGIMLVESAIALTVCCALLSLFFAFATAYSDTGNPHE